MLAEVVTQVILEEEKRQALNSDWSQWASYWTDYTSLQSRVWGLWFVSQWMGWNEYFFPSQQRVEDFPK